MIGAFGSGGGLRALLLAVGMGVLAVPGVRAQDLETAVRESYPTNLTMLGEATKSAVSELFLGFNHPPGAVLLVEPADKHKANWFVENQILSYLSKAGYRAYLHWVPYAGPEGAEGDSVGALVPPPEERRAQDSDLVLRYRVVDFEITYPDNYRKSPLGSRKVQRRATVSVLAQLLQGEREDVTWVGTGDVERLDVVPAGKLPLLEGSAFPFDKPELKTRGVGSLVEPALVTGIVAGLIYLFYTNQN